VQETIPQNVDFVDTFTYEVDAYNVVCRTGSSRGTAAPYRDLTFTTSSNSFESMFADEKTKSVFENILEQVRTHKTVVSFPYRCDTDAYCSYYRLTVSISTTNRVLFYNKILGMDPRPNGVVWRPVEDESNQAVPLCSICNSLFAEGSWMELQEMIDLKLWTPDETTMPCRYTVCDPCERGIEHRISESKNQRNCPS
jgi:hypothetical protein